MTRKEALAELLRFLKAADYRFVAVTPATHAKVLSRPAPPALGLRDIFGWNRPFDASAVSPTLLEILEAADALDSEHGKLRSRVRVASLGGDLLLHGAYPTSAPDAVFFGPDTYRFARFIEQKLPHLGESKWLVDMGAGSGAGAIAAATFARFARVTMIDANESALELAQVNAAAAGVRAEATLADSIPAGADLVIANPPYMMDPAGRSYRDGGGLLGGEIAIDWVRQALARLAPGGAMLLYTGAAFVDGEAPLAAELAKACAHFATFELTEIDPDVFGEELDQSHYQRVERIAAVGAVIRLQAR